MRNLFLFIRKYYPFFLFLFLEIIALLLVSQSNTHQHSTFVNSSNRISGSVYERQNRVSNYFGLQKENEVLEAENARLRALLDNFPDKIDSIHIDSTEKQIYEYWPAKVINHTTQKKYNYFTLDKGSKDGIVKGMGVINSDGLVGKITNVSANYSVGLSMLNKNMHTSVKHKKSNAIGLMRWTGAKLLNHKIDDVTKTAKVEIGDTFVTSGYSTFYPKDIPVGVVTYANLPDGRNFFEIEIELTNDILSLNSVYVVNHYDKIELDSLEAVVE